MPGTVELASALQSLTDDALDALVRIRQVPQQAASYFDVAEHLLTRESVAAALTTLTTTELAALARGETSAELDAIGLGVRGAAVDEARRQAALVPTVATSVQHPGNSTVGAEHAFATTLLVGDIVRSARAVPVPLLTRGTLAMADARRRAETLTVPVADVLAATELARTADLLVSRDATLVASTLAADWLALPLTARWATLRSNEVFAHCS